MNELLEKESDVIGVRMSTVAMVSLLIHLLAFYSVTGVIGIIENNKKKNYISVELIQNSQGFSQARSRPARKTEAVSPPVEQTVKAPEDAMSLTPQIDSVAAPAHAEASGQETGPVSNAKAGYLPIHRVGKQPYFKIQVKPVYPASERASGVEARVMVEIDLNRYGGVDNVRIVKSGGRFFDEAVIKAVMTSSFEPAYVDGQPTEVRVQIPYLFKLE